MSLRFACTACGRCCHDLRLPLSLREARDWAERGGTVELLADATPALDEPFDETIAYRRERALPARSGALAIRVNLTPVARFAGPCPHLLPNMYCGAYEERPNTCRIYPAELLPGRLVDPQAKSCPDEAWADGGPMMEQRGVPADTTVAAAITDARAQALADVTGKAHLARLLGIDRTALANEGFVVHRPEAAALLAALAIAIEAPAAGDDDWRFASPSPETRALVAEAGAVAVEVEAADYIGF